MELFPNLTPEHDEAAEIQIWEAVMVFRDAKRAKAEQTDAAFADARMQTEIALAHIEQERS